MMAEEELLQTALEKDDAEFLLDRAISGLYTGRMDSRLALWLGRRLERLQKGEDARKLFKLENPEGAPRGKHGAGRYDTDQVAALWELARRRFERKGDADDAVAQACGLKDPSSVARLVRDDGYKLARLDDDMLKVMAGDDLLKRVWPKSPAPDAEEVYEWGDQQAKLKPRPWLLPPNAEVGQATDPKGSGEN
jgi:hypothetical protein